MSKPETAQTAPYPSYPLELGEPWAWHFAIGDGSEVVVSGYTAVCECVAAGWKPTPLYPLGWNTDHAKEVEA